MRFSPHLPQSSLVSVDEEPSTSEAKRPKYEGMSLEERYS